MAPNEQQVAALEFLKQRWAQKQSFTCDDVYNYIVNNASKAWGLATVTTYLRKSWSKTGIVKLSAKATYIVSIDLSGWTPELFALIVSQTGGVLAFQSEEWAAILGDPSIRTQIETNLPDGVGIGTASVTQAEAALLSIAKDKLPFAMQILETFSQRTPAERTSFLNTLNSDQQRVLDEMGGVLRIIRYQDAFEELKALVSNPAAVEQDFQNLLEQNPWMFGSEYVHLHAKRDWVRAVQLDFVFIRAIDDYPEIIELKRAGHPVLKRDSRGNLRFSGELNAALGQTLTYMYKLEQDRNVIERTPQLGHDTIRVRAKIIIGRSLDVTHPGRNSAEHKLMLRVFNSHLVGVEIMTYDHLISTAESVIKMFSENI